MPVALATILGAAIGSFLNVVAYRLPRHESLIHPPSRCPGCDTAIRPYDNIPVLGWLLLRGHCRQCHAAISSRYPIVEASTAVRHTSTARVSRGSPAPKARSWYAPTAPSPGAATSSAM